MDILLFLLVLLVLVVAHEYGHFITAKLSGMRVDEFAFGFPPRLFSIKRGETRYVFNLLPLGGYVKIYGEDPNEVTGEKDLKRSFNHSPLWKQAAVISAGVVFNFLLAWILLSLTLMLGVSAVKDPASPHQLSGVEVMITGVAPDGPATRAGLKEGDIVRSIKVKEEEYPILLSEELTSVVSAHEGKEITVSVMRGDEGFEFSVIPEVGIIEGRAAIGVYMDEVGLLKLPAHLALWEGAKRTWTYTHLTAEGIGTFLKGVIFGHSDFSQVTGPVGIVNAVGSAAERGFSNVLLFTAIISINLAIINMIPFPALDGGRLLFVIIEGIIRRPIPAKVASITNLAGFALLMILMVLVTYHDIIRLI